MTRTSPSTSYVIDANVGVGDRRDRPSPVRDAAELLAEMDRHGVDRALVYAVQGEDISALDGNQQLESWLADGAQRLLPLWMAAPGPESLAQLQALHAQGRVRAVRLHDTQKTSSPLTAWAYTDLLAWLLQEDLPLWVSLADNDPVQLADTFGGQFRELRTVLVGAHYTNASYILPLLRHLPRAHLELSRHEGLCAIEELARDVGARRLLYGSYYPRYAMGPILWSLQRQAIEPHQLQRILAGTVAELLGLEEADR